MKAEIIHDPTRGWLLLTEKWPGERPDSTAFRKTDDLDGWLKLDIEYHQKVKACLSTAIEIAKEDWDEVTDFVFFHGYGTYDSLTLEQDTPYSVDAEFEVSETSSGIVAINNQTSGMVFKKIARLVKAKEDYSLVNWKNPTYDIESLKLVGENPTDSVTSDGSKWIEPNEWTKHGHFETKTESQDELWEEVYASYTSAEGTLYVEDLKKNFRIERI